jgi:monoamine oxidase
VNAKMSLSRRTFLAGAATGVTALVLTACTPARPTPAPTPTGTPTAAAGPVPAPLALSRSGWAADEFARGSHSFIAVHASPDQRATLREPLQDRVFFAGEATSDDSPATVVGAAESGVRAAAEVLASGSVEERVAVIGAGAAGAAAAERLRDYGFDVTVIEARERVGGRIDTRRTDAWPIPVELGAGWAPEQGSAVSIRLTSLGITTTAAAEEIARRTPEGTETDESNAGADAIQSALTWASGRSDDASLTDALSGSGASDLDDEGNPPTPADRLDQALRQQVEIARGADPDSISSWYGLVEDPAPTDERVLGGYADYIDAQLADLDVWLSTAVTSVSYGDNGVSLRLSTGESVSVDRVVVTVPLGVLKGEGIAFEPALPFDRRAAIADLGFAATDTVWVLFDEPFWETDAVRWSLLGGDTAVSEWLNLRPITGENVLVGMVGGAQAAALAELDDTALADAVIRSLEPFAPVA